jgi:hypothetical protein
MTESEAKSKGYKSALAKKIIESVVRNCSDEEIISWSESAFFGNFDKAHEHVSRVAREFDKDKVPF